MKLVRAFIVNETTMCCRFIDSVLYLMQLSDSQSYRR